MPVSTLIAGAIGSVVHVSFLFAFAAVWILGIAVFCLCNGKIRGLKTEN
ncbi:hypothetical protein ACFO4N_09970 [Camelliibacillus cellulosilyticus]|uniref:Uncharacterized protein n=1 Tax=Camelliibacillus cellulosilyticus TaxID=2174486 RepID=A0ABV9GQ36_9BACL